MSSEQKEKVLEGKERLWLGIYLSKFAHSLKKKFDLYRNFSRTRPIFSPYSNILFSPYSNIKIYIFKNLLTKTNFTKFILTVNLHWIRFWCSLQNVRTDFTRKKHYNLPVYRDKIYKIHEKFFT